MRIAVSKSDVVLEAGLRFAVIAIGFVAIAQALVAFQHMTGATRGFGAYFGVASIVVAALWGRWYGLLGVVMYCGLMDFYWYGERGLGDLSPVWMASAALPAAIGVLVVDWIAQRARNNPAKCRLPEMPHASYGEQIVIGEREAERIIAQVRAGDTYRLTWALTQIARQSPSSGVEVGFASRIARELVTNHAGQARIAKLSEPHSKVAARLVGGDQITGNEDTQ